MPECLKKWLESLDETQAQEVFDFLDEEPNALELMSAIAAERAVQ